MTNFFKNPRQKETVKFSKLISAGHFSRVNRGQFKNRSCFLAPLDTTRRLS